jgi:hypothetical protein
VVLFERIVQLLTAREIAIQQIETFTASAMRRISVQARMSRRGRGIDYRGAAPGAADGVCGSLDFGFGSVTALQPAPGRSGLVQTASSPERVFKRQTTVWFSPRAI